MQRVERAIGIERVSTLQRKKRLNFFKQSQRSFPITKIPNTNKIILELMDYVTGHEWTTHTWPACLRKKTVCQIFPCVFFFFFLPKSYNT